MATVKIENDKLKVIIDTKGAELLSVRSNSGREFIWDGETKIWEWHAPILFPICGELNENSYTYKGKKYFMKRHGFARDMEFEKVSKAEGRGGFKCSADRASTEYAEFVLSSNEKTLKMYPFEFVLRVIYELSGNALIVKYIVENRTAGDMYFSIGSHEGYVCSEGIQAYSVFVDEIVPLVYDYFEGEPDTLVYEKPGFTAATLKKLGENITVTVDFGEVSSFSLWTKPGARFICLEPWHGIPETEQADPDISKKAGFIKLTCGESFEAVHTITFCG